MARRERVTPTAPGKGLVAIQTPLVAMLEAGCGVDVYLRLVRSGRLDAGRRTIKFNSTPGAVDELRKRGRTLPDGLPDMHGDVTWRRGPQHWSLDANYAQIAPDVVFWSSIGKGLSQIRFDGVRLPNTVIDNLVGRPLRDVVAHPFIDHPDIVITAATTSGPYPATNGFGNGRPAMTEFKISMPPVLVFPDPEVNSAEYA